MRFKKKGRPDLFIFFVTLLLLAIGVIMVFSASYYDTLEDDPYFYLRKQITWAGLGLVAMLVMTKIDYFRLKPYINLAFGVGIILLILVLFSDPVKGSRRWIDLGFTSVQPSEIMKLCIVFFVAKRLSRPRTDIKKFFTGVCPYLGILALVGFLIMLEPDLGTTVAIAGTVGVLLIAAGLRFFHFTVLFCLGVAGVVLLIIMDPTRLNRITGWWSPWSHAGKEGYQIVNSLYALGSGGFFGMGLGNSRQKLDYLPEQHTDFIFAILGEELGFLGAFFVVVLFFLFAWRGYRIALRCPDPFGCLLAVGITTMIVLQAFINMGVVTGLLPVTGIGLPFISYGGSSMLITMVGVGTLLNISRYMQKT
ncbi:MAG TPA: putative lipid II flippase FtsW [Peptococcaceae bacterium]|jgi:cell division protein FtsW|nr:putative lipid II flippase FtsW [Clostridia bacterium]HOB81816.1 putative lipid II flippase FtsW [Peptococcaceae bacterium]HPZ71675.1 putative lipid II flippase FtsW [Peptococcaceae bacterium]HQD53722.1 putative lipid II flippase FtsW [Peptococcaceae bacterium]